MKYPLVGKFSILCMLLVLPIIFFQQKGRSMTNTTMQPHQMELDKNNVKQTVFDLENLGERKSWDGQKRASDYIKDRLEKMGLAPRLHRYSHKEKEWENIWLEFKGEVRGGSKILVVAHYDSTSRGMSEKAPGADDNGTGVAVLLELARLFSTESFNHDVQLAFFSNEENGHQGSKAYVAKLKNDSAQIKAALNIDIVGYTDSAALFTGETTAILKGDLPPLKKVKMVLKMVYNLGLRVLERGKILKIAGRSEDNHLQPRGDDAVVQPLADIIKWKFGDNCA